MGRSMSAAVVVSLCMLVLCSDMAHASTYVVGGRDGWGTNASSSSWRSGKVFKTGDQLLFVYDPTKHNVVVTNEGGYFSCDFPDGSKTYQTGHDYIQLVKGTNYFISSFPPVDCIDGTHTSVTAL